MNPAEFGKQKSGLLVKGALGYWAFVPNPLEPSLTLDLASINALSNADRALSELAGMARILPNPHLLIRPFMRKEAVLSSRIEGTQASLSDLLLFEAASKPEKDESDVGEVANYVKALEYGLARLDELPLSLRLIREIHEELMSGVRGDHLTPGQFRKTQNWIGSLGCSLNDATYVPPPVMEMNEALNLFESYLHSQSKLPPLIKLALIHYHFEAIHPFLDGNGRVGRLLITLLFCTENLLPQPLLYLSAFFEKNRDEYYRCLLDVSRQGAWLSWINYFLEAVTVQSQDAIKRTEVLLNLWNNYRARLQKARASVLLLSLVDMLFSYPSINNRIASEQLKITPRSAQLNIDKLVSEKILTETTGQKRNRIYLATEVVKALE
jgi:Fic family protein